MTFHESVLVEKGQIYILDPSLIRINKLRVWGTIITRESK